MTREQNQLIKKIRHLSPEDVARVLQFLEQLKSPELRVVPAELKAVANEAVANEAVASEAVASAEPAQLAADASITSAIESVRPRIRNDAFHEALGDILRSLAENGAESARRSTTR